jgi:hypothetical protein
MTRALLKHKNLDLTVYAHLSSSERVGYDVSMPVVRDKERNTRRSPENTPTGFARRLSRAEASLLSRV